MTKSLFSKKTLSEFLKLIADSEDPGTLLMQIIQNRSGIISTEDAGDILLKYYPEAVNSSVYQLTQQVISRLLALNYTSNDFYNCLCSFIKSSPLLINNREREAALLIVLTDFRLPYFQLHLITMSDTEFNERATRNKELIEKLHHASLRSFTQKTEQGSAVLSLILQSDNEEDRAVLMGSYISFISSQNFEVPQAED